MKRTICNSLVIAFLFVFISSVAIAQTVSDSNAVLKKVTVTSNKKQNVFTKPVPVQLLNQQTLQQLNGYSVGDAAQYFSGVLIKDYGGIGGLKTISVRSLGASSTGVLYDGIPVADAQSGQIDLSKFSSTFVQSLELDLANPQQVLLPARAYSSAAVLSITSNTFSSINFTQKKWQVGTNQGSFGLWQPFAGVYIPVTKSFVVSANAEATWDNGNYSYTINNGIFSQNAHRKNSDIKSFQGELNAVKQFSDSDTLETKIWVYTSERGLPGSVIFFNNISVQRLWDNDLFAQTRFQTKINTTTDLLISAKYSYLFTKYIDPDFLNNSGGLDDQYTQQEGYLSVALSKHFGKYITTSFASDIASTGLTANIKNFPTPTRIDLWNNLAIQFAKKLWQIDASVLNTNNADRTKVGPSLENKNEFTPTIAASYKISFSSPFLLRAFYKKIFRMPTFNDVYYNYISNIDPKLLPEYTDQYDVGVTYSKILNSALKHLNISVDGYYNNIRDKIVAVPSQNLFMWTVTNIGKVDIKGVDLTAEINGAFNSKISWSTRIAYTFQQALDVTDPSNSEYKNQIPYTPNNSGSGLVVVNYESCSAGYNLLFSDYRYTLGENNSTNRLPGWATHGVFVTRKMKLYQVYANIKVAVDNLFDARYDVVQYYPMPGRSYKISLIFNN
ncbi:MAG TPA: TonB-dependent receptor [Ferruginibacter sp.]|nr:TonB-dependent receptor [Ferruginibacter sp.]